MSLRNRKQQGFTLVEILIVVVILGILAAIVIPQFTNASEAARASNVISQLQSVRSQLELYQLQHNGGYPPESGMDGTDAAIANALAGIIDADFDNLINPTDQAGTIVAVGTAGALGPYMGKPPINPFTAGGLGDVVATSNTVALPGASLNEGWCYSALTGEIRASLSAVAGIDTAALGFNPLDFQ